MVKHSSQAIFKEQTIKTYRYLRLAMVILLIMLAAAVAIEKVRGPGCWQTSISAYYYTPVQAIFVGSLMALGVCMVVLKAVNEWEDILLNVGGMLAPVVALVPTPGTGVCRSVPMGSRDTPADIDNNVAALLVAGVLGVLITSVLAIKEGSAERPGAWDQRKTIGIGVAIAMVMAGIAWFKLDPETFTHCAHYVAAGLLFACIVGVVILNALQYRQKVQNEASKLGDSNSNESLANRYSAIALAMVGSIAGIGLWKWVIGWDHWLLVAEGVTIGLFAIFWFIQTEELWHEGPRLDMPMGGD